MSLVTTTLVTLSGALVWVLRGPYTLILSPKRKVEVSEEELEVVRQKVLQKADANNDGKIELGEFSKLVTTVVCMVEGL